MGGAGEALAEQFALSTWWYNIGVRLGHHNVTCTQLSYMEHNCSSSVLPAAVRLMLYCLQYESMKKDFFGKEDYSRVQVRSADRLQKNCLFALPTGKVV